MKKNRIQKIVVAGILMNKKQQILLLQRGPNETVLPNLWELPSGKKELGETTMKALKREFKEETNLDIKVVKPIAIFDYTIKKPNEIRETTQINFLVELEKNSAKLKLSNEHADSAWLDISKLNSYYISTKIKQIIKKII